MSQEQIRVTQQQQYLLNQYSFAYCLKNEHKQSLKRFICLEDQCEHVKQICQICFKDENDHSNHTVIHSELLLKIARQKLILSKVPQQIEMIDEKILKLKSQMKELNLIDALEELKKLLKKVVGYHNKKTFNVFQTNQIIELTYKMIAFNKNFRMIKLPYSLSITEFDIQVETVSSIFDMVNLKAKRTTQPEENLLTFQDTYRNQQQHNRPTREYSESEYFKPRKSYSCKINAQLQPSQLSESQSTNDSISSRQIRTRSMDMALDLSQLIVDDKQGIKHIVQENKIQNVQDEDALTVKNIEQFEEPKENKNKIQLIEKSALQNLIDDYNNFEVIIDSSKMHVIQRAHEGIIYNLIDLGEGSGNSIRQLVTLGEDGLMKFWNPANYQCVHAINFKSNDLNYTTQIRDIQYLKRIKCIAAVCKSSVVIISVLNYKVIKTIYVEANNLDSSDQLGMLFLVNPPNKSILMYDLFSFKQIGQLSGAQEDITSLAYAQIRGKFYYFTGEKNGNLSKYDLDEQKYLFSKKVNRLTIFYLSTVRYQSGDECLVAYSCNEYVKSSYVKFVNIDNLDVIVNLTFSSIDSAICYNNEIYLMQSNNNIIQILVENNKFSIKKMLNIPSSFGKGHDVFNEGMRWVKSERVALLSQFSRTQHFSNLVLFPIV